MGTFPRGIPLAQRIVPSKELRAQMRTNIQTATPNPTWASSRFEFPNPQDLRGIPAIGRGVAGCIGGTNPDTITRREDAA